MNPEREDNLKQFHSRYDQEPIPEPETSPAARESEQEPVPEPENPLQQENKYSRREIFKSLGVLVGSGVSQEGIRVWAAGQDQKIDTSEYAISPEEVVARTKAAEKQLLAEAKESLENKKESGMALKKKIWSAIEAEMRQQNYRASKSVHQAYKAGIAGAAIGLVLEKLSRDAEDSSKQASPTTRRALFSAIGSALLAIPKFRKPAPDENSIAERTAAAVRLLESRLDEQRWKKMQRTAEFDVIAWAILTSGIALNTKEFENRFNAQDALTKYGLAYSKMHEALNITRDNMAKGWKEDSPELPAAPPRYPTQPLKP